MATLVPPPSKRQKVAAAAKAREQQEVPEIPSNLGTVDVQFFDQTTGKAAASIIKIPVAESSTTKLELLLNSLLGKDGSDRTPYKFAIRLDPLKDKKGIKADITGDLYHALLKPGIRATEDLITLDYIPQAVFRVKAATRCSAAMNGHKQPILCAQFSPQSSSRAATGSGDNNARIWDCDTGTPVHTLRTTAHVLVVSWSPDGTILATGSKDGTIGLWDPKTGKPLSNPLKGHRKYIRDLSWEPYHLQKPNRPRLASASKDATVRIWDVALKRVEEVLTGHNDSVSAVLWGGLGSIYTCSHDRTIKVWFPDGRLQYTLTGHGHWINHLALSTDRVLRTSFYEHGSQAPADEEAKKAQAKQRFEAAARADGALVERLASASDDNTIYLWTPSQAQKPIARLMGHAKPINHVAYSPNGRLLASASFENHVKLWSGIDGTFLYSLRAHVGPVYMTCFSADDRLLVSASKDTTLKVWDTETGKLRFDLPGHKDAVYAVDWAYDGQMVVSGGADRQVRIWRH